MRLGQGCRRRSPWWCYVVMVAAAAAVLPGAAWVAAEEEESVSESAVEVEAPRPYLAPLSEAGTKHPVAPMGTPVVPRVMPLPPATESRAYPVAPVPKAILGGKREELDEATRERLKSLQAGFGDEPVCIEYYPVEDILAEMQSKLGITEQKTKTYLVRRLAYEFYRTRKPHDPPWVRWHGKQLEVVQTMEGQRQIEVALERMRKLGFHQVLIDIRWLSASVDEIERLIPDDLSVFGASAFSRANTDTRPSGNFTFNVLAQKQTETLFKRIKKMKSVRILASPTLVTTNGREACFRVGTSKSFITGFTGDKPDVQIVRPGLSVDVDPLLLDNGRVRLDCRLKSTFLRDIQAKEVKHPVTGKMVDVEIPNVSVLETVSCVEMQLGQTMVIRGLEQETSSGKTEEMIVTARVEAVSPAGPVQR